MLRCTAPTEYSLQLDTTGSCMCGRRRRTVFERPMIHRMWSSLPPCGGPIQFRLKSCDPYESSACIFARTGITFGRPNICSGNSPTTTWIGYLANIKHFWSIIMTKLCRATAALFVFSPAAFAATPASLIQTVNGCCAALEHCCEEVADCCDD